MCKFADDTYLIIQSTNEDSRSAEIDHVEDWARTNNLTLNRAKSKEIVFTNKKRKRQVSSQLSFIGIDRVTAIVILGFTVTSGLAVLNHVRDVITSCAQFLYALRVLRAHGMCDVIVHTVYRSVVVSKILYAASAWWVGLHIDD